MSCETLKIMQGANQMNAENQKLKITNSIMQKTFVSAHILTILCKDEGKLHYFRVTTLLAG